MKVKLVRRQHPHKGTTLQRRLVFFFISVTVLLIVAFTMLLFLFGFMGKEEKAVETFFHNELEHISGSVYEDFGLLAVDGLDYAKTVIASCEEFWRANSVSAETFASHPELLEPLLAAQMPTILATANTHSCGGVFVLLDATVNPSGENAATSRAGIFVKKTQPTSVQSVGVKIITCAVLRRSRAIMELNCSVNGKWNLILLKNSFGIRSWKRRVKMNSFRCHVCIIGAGA